MRVTPFRALITLLITYLLSPLPLQVGFNIEGIKELRVWSLELRVTTLPRFFEEFYKGVIKVPGFCPGHEGV